jgi:hypothetical protein
MALTKSHTYTDQDGDTIEVPQSFPGFPDVLLRLADSEDSIGVYVDPKDAAPLALNILGHDRPDYEPLATTFSVEEAVAHIAGSKSSRDAQLNLAAALLKAVDAYDRREKRRATDAERRERAARTLGRTVSDIRRASNELTGDDIGKLREALGRYDAALVN